MDLLIEVIDWIVGFLGIRELMEILNTDNYKAFLTYDGFIAIIRPIFPFVLLIEVIAGLLYKKFNLFDFKISFFSFVLNSVLGQFIAIAAVVVLIGLLERYAIIETAFTWYWFIYGYVVWEFGHFIYHYLGHKVRLFWCLHSTHHTPEKMSLSVSYAHFFLEGPYAQVIRTTVCILLGVSPEMLFVIMFIDGVYGGFIHIGEHLYKDGRFGVFYKYILTPSHHRVHHGKNPLYMDTNFCNLLNIWDRIFGTYQPEDKKIPVVYGITREMKPNSFVDAYFGEFSTLIKDVYRAPGIKNKLLYIIMPPGWSHTGEHQTADVVRKEYLKQNQNVTQVVPDHQSVLRTQKSNNSKVSTGIDD